jgi:hypothetical protein
MVPKMTTPLDKFTREDLQLLLVQKSSRNTRWRSLMRHCATSRKVVGSTLEFFIDFGRSTTMGSTVPLTEMGTSNISWGVNAAGAWSWQPYYLHVLIVSKSESLSVSVIGLYSDLFTFMWVLQCGWRGRIICIWPDRMLVLFRSVMT